MVVNTPPTSSWSGSTYQPAQPTRRTGMFSRIEVRDILIAWVALSSAFLLAQRGGFIQGIGLVANLGVSLVAVGLGFVLHELMHKFTAQRYGYWAEFRMWPFGVVFALITSLLGFIFAAPGATYIMGYDVPDRQNGVISLAGPLTNVLIAALFLPLLLVGNFLYQQIGAVGLQVNLFLAAFNMLPIMPLDGAKVWRWNKLLWVLIELPLGALVAGLFLGIL